MHASSKACIATRVRFLGTGENKEVGMSMSFCRLAVAPLLFLVGSCLSQDKGGVDQRVALPEVQRILSSERRSGSLEYWGFCDLDKGWPDFPEPRSVSGRKGPALNILQEMFADDPKMRVIQERDGKIRMVETDVPTDFLDVKIHHLSFPSAYHSGPMALQAILHAPEVIDFMSRNIGHKVSWDGWGMPGQIFTDGPSVPGDLNDVTVAQAMDYVLETFPGVWTYQNCYNSGGERKISVGFLRFIPVSGASPPKTK
jgi:hypothetical protein